MSPFKASRVTRPYTMKIKAPPEQVFPLLCPVREAEWIGGWHYTLVYSESGIAEQDCVFITPHPGVPDTIWVTTKYNPEDFLVEYVNITPDVRVERLHLVVRGNGDGTSDVQTSRTYTALSEKGNADIAHRTAEKNFNESMITMERRLNYYLETGKMLKH